METISAADLILAAVLLIFVILGARRGLFKALTGLLVVIAAFLGAAFLANLATEPLTALLYPKVENRFIEMVLPLIEQAPDTGLLASLDALHAKLAEFGLDSSAITALWEGFDVSEVVSTAAMAVFQSVLQGILTIVLFILLLITLKLLVSTFNLVFKLPLLNFVNTLGGAVFGLIEGGLLIFLSVFLLQKCGVSLADFAKNSVLLSFFLSHSPYSLLTAFLLQVG